MEVLSSMNTAQNKNKFNPAHFREYNGANVMNLAFTYKYNKTLIPISFL